MKTKEFDLKGKMAGAKRASHGRMPSGGWREDIFVCKFLGVVQCGKRIYGSKRFAGIGPL
ncbi:hypothetical protein [Silvimonas iriomotensis]|uniref:hypothetical protein n=1 Tax=Silvimonas iriomotensis TaxID=449662 RepID=UPI00166ED9DB|nr:hypothetical protein [Silvimonas iriomotensis]